MPSTRSVFPSLCLASHRTIGARRDGDPDALFFLGERQIEGPPQAAYVDPAELAAERRDKTKADSIQTWVVSVGPAPSSPLVASQR